MRHMYNSDGMIAYAGKPRASRPWKSSRYKAPSAPRERRVTLDDKESMREAALARGARLRY